MNSEKLKIFITIDTEDKYFEVPRLITGEGIKGSPGVYMIIDILHKYNCKANFFLNVYEHVNYNPGVLEKIAVNICNYGHEVELHTHPNERLYFYKRSIDKYPLEEQKSILQYGKKLIYDWIGRNPIAHRGGSYSCNDDTLTALNKAGIPVDSSYWFKNPNNVFKNNFTINKVAKYNNTFELPVVYVDYYNSDGKRSDSKFDIDWLNLDEIEKVIELAKENNLRTLTLFLHSFSFIEKINKNVSEADDPRAIFVSKPIWGNTCAQIIGVDEEKISRFKKILEYITSDKDIEILTIREWYNSSAYLYDLGDDYVPLIQRQ